MEKFKTRVKDRGLLILNSSLAKTSGLGRIKVLQFPFTDLAIELGNIKVANMVALGCYLGAKKIVKIQEVFEVFRSMVPAGKSDILEINQKALQEGAKLGNG